MRPASTGGIRGVAMVSLACAGLATACESQRGGVDWGVSVDTVGGTSRVINTPPPTGAQPTVVGEEDLRIGAEAEAGPTSFGMIRSIAVLRDGRIAIGDAQAEEVRVFDREGRHVHTFGGQGAGPGELRGMQGVYLDSDGLLRVPEQQNGRISIFDPDSGFVRSYPLRMFSYAFRGPWEAAFDSDGRTLVASSGPYRGGSWNMLRIYDAEMTQVDSVPYHDYTEEIQRDDRPGVWVVPLGNGRGFIGVPFYAQRQETLSPTGEFWTSREGTQEVEVARWTPPGDTTLVLYSRRPPIPVSSAERDSAMAEASARLAGRMAGAPKLDPSKVPATKPPVYSLSLDDRGRLWVRVTGPHADPTLYDVFTGDGRYAQTVKLPFTVDDWIPPVVHGDTLWAVTTGDLDVQYVVRARLRSLKDK